MDKANLHAGHRSRMRQRFLNSGLEGFSDHEVLELLLFYAVPRRDVNELAHMLTARFGNLSAALDAPWEELCNIPGIGPRVARFLTLIPQVMVRMVRSPCQGELTPLRKSSDLAALLAARCPHLAPPHTLLLLTDSAHNLVALHHYDSFDALSIRELAIRVTNARASLLVLAECVPDCTGFPLPGRLAALDRFARDLDALGVPLWDYFTFDALGHAPHSYARTGQLLPW